MHCWIAVPVLCLAGAQTLTAQYIHPKFKSNERTVHTVAVVTPKVEASGKANESYKASDLADKLSEIVSEALKNAGRDVQPAPTDEKQVAALQASFDAAKGNPNDVGKGKYRLGPDIAKTAPAVDALVFVRADAVFDSIVSGSRDATSLSITITPKNKVRSRFSMVDAKTGDVLYYFTADGKGDNSQTWASLEKGVSTGLSRLPK